MADAADTKMRRGLLLSALAAQYPSGLVERFITQQLAPMYGGEPRGLPQDLAYLAERKLIRRDETTALGMTIVTYTCTADGVCVNEGSAKDPGVQAIG
ncbi:hypothetical protein L6R49_10450 [Myxococcota bacterium]|nr:hypothetical protein [Myxococcota bacterium]